MLTIQVMSINGAPPPAPMVGVFTEPAGSIGRNEACTLVLPDPERRISRQHARIQATAAGYEIRNEGAGLPLLVNGQALDHGASVALKHADLLQIGPYEMRVALAPAAPADASTQVPVPRAAAAAAPAAAGADPLALFGATPAPAPAAAPAAPAADPLQLFGGAVTVPASSDPFADLLAPAPPPRAATQAPPPPGAPLIPDDFDPLAEPPAPAPRTLGGEFDLGAGPGVPGQSIDDLFGLGARPAAALGASPLSAGAPPSPALFPPGHPLAEPIAAANTAGSADPLAALQRGPATVSPLSRLQRDDVPAIATPFRLPDAVPGAPAAEPFLSWQQDGRGEVEPTGRIEVGAPPAAPAPQPAPAPAAAAAALPGDVESLQKLLQALLDGAGVADLPRPPPMSPEFMRVLGELLRIATEGTLQLLIARAMTKREVQAHATMIAARENNPLKFSPTVEVALQHLLSPGGRGFMTPARAMKDAYDDLRSHQVGVMAGMQAALAGVLARFDPAQLEQRLTEKSVLDAVLPSQRKARLWDLFIGLYGEISREAEDDFHSLFGKAFVKAYEAQIQKLNPERPPPR